MKVKLQPYQKELLDGLRKGALTHVHMSRGTGKSTLHNVAKAFFEDRAAREWTEWRPTTSWIPRKSWYGKWIIGRMYKRGRWEDADMGGDFSGYTFSKPTRVRQYISKKELFKWKLKYGPNGS